MDDLRASHFAMAPIRAQTSNPWNLPLMKKKKYGYAHVNTQQPHHIVMVAIKNCKQIMKPILTSILVVLLAAMSTTTYADADTKAEYVDTPYTEQKVVFDFYMDDPKKIGSALYWIRSLINPLMDAPYNYAPEFMDIVVVIHGTEIVTIAKKNYKKYQQVVDRMRYYSNLGVKFKVCGLAAKDYQYSEADFQDFIEIVPSAITELAHWQLKGYALITPKIMFKKYSIEEIR